MNNSIIITILTIPAILLGFTVHEYAHGKMADRLGDKTARFQGRLTFNPLAHVDIFGFVSMLILGFGWAKPIQVNTRAFKNYYKDDLKVSLAGPLANLVTAIIFSVIFGIYFRLASDASNTIVIIIWMMLQQVIRVNVVLFIFNLLPIPGFDGFKILIDLFPRKFGPVANKMYQYQMPIMLGVAFLGRSVIGIPVELVMNLMRAITNIF